MSLLHVAGVGELVLAEKATAGSNHETWFGTTTTGSAVVVKIGAAAGGRLRNERTALRLAASHGIGVPEVRGAGVAGDGRDVLVLNRVAGVPPEGPASWGRLGRALARLLEVPATSSGLRVVTGEAFARAHGDMLTTVRPLLSAAAADAVRRAIGRVAAREERALTHGDPGPGNYLDDGGGGVLLDWESASVAPLGIDVGRLAFIALLDIARSGQPGPSHRAAVEGYREVARSRIDHDLVASATMVAGLQLVHSRLTRPRRADRTAAGAAAVLESFLAQARAPRSRSAEA